LDIHKSTFYNWLGRYHDGGIDALEDKKAQPSLPLNSSRKIILVGTMVYRGHFVVCNYFVTLAYFFTSINSQNPCNINSLADAELQTLHSVVVARP